jgi:hypothetical protein
LSCCARLWTSFRFLRPLSPDSHPTNRKSVDSRAGNSARPAATPEQRCYRCQKMKGADEFVRQIDDRHYNMCRACLSEVLVSRTPSKERLRHSSTHRTCYLCRRVLPTAAFTRRANGTFFSACKDCNRNVFAQRRRARLARADGSCTETEWRALLALYDRCPRCLRRWAEIPLLSGQTSSATRDHIVPISKGGSNGGVRTETAD